MNYNKIKEYLNFKKNIEKDIESIKQSIWSIGKQIGAGFIRFSKNNNKVNINFIIEGTKVITFDVDDTENFHGILLPYKEALGELVIQLRIKEFQLSNLVVDTKIGEKSIAYLTPVGIYVYVYEHYPMLSNVIDCFGNKHFVSNDDLTFDLELFENYIEDYPQLFDNIIKQI